METTVCVGSNWYGSKDEYDDDPADAAAPGVFLDSIENLWPADAYNDVGAQAVPRPIDATHRMLDALSLGRVW